MRSPIATAFLRWAFLRAAFTRGYWLTTSVYLVVVAHLTPAELILIGTFQGVTVVIAEVPAGVLADTVSRRLSLVIAHVVMGAGMAMAGLVTAFPLLVVSQCLWGLGWAFSSGADVAWLTDELDRPDVVDGVLVAQARWGLSGTAVGIVSFGVLAWATTLSAAIVVSGVAIVLLGLVVARWPETGFTPADAGRRWRESASILRRGVALARADRVILTVIVATLLVNGATEAYGRLLQQHVVALGLPAHPSPVMWFAALSLTGVALGAVALRIVEARIAGVGVAKRAYVLACVVGSLGMLLFAHAPNTATAVAGALLVSGIADPVIRATGIIWVNRRATSAVRATVHSQLSLAENAGEIVFGVSLALVARSASAAVALTCAAALLAGAGVVVTAVQSELRCHDRRDDTASRLPST